MLITLLQPPRLPIPAGIDLEMRCIGYMLYVMDTVYSAPHKVLKCCKN